jgi:hypothetical protein
LTDGRTLSVLRVGRVSGHDTLPAEGADCSDQTEGRRADMIKKVKGGYQLLSTKGKNLGGPYKTQEEAKKRLRQVEFFKHKKG